jgi:hypothetical protein
LRLALILAALVFVVTLLVRLPASLLLSHLPAEIVCDEPSGTLWHGSCDQVHDDGISIAGVSWTLHPASLLKLTLSADLSSADPNAGGSASITVDRSGDASITALHATLPLTAGSNVLPAGSSATLVLSLPSAKIRDQHLVAIEGTIDLNQLHVANAYSNFGSFEMQFPPADENAVINGQLRDLNGPLAVTGLMKLQPSGAYEINGTVATHAGAPEDLEKTLQVLGPADPQGLRTFSLAGTL